MLPELTEWESFYVIVGAAAGALIGLQFVVMTLVAEHRPSRADEASAAFSTPTIIHFSTALLLSALLRIPWHAITFFSVAWGLVGCAGTIYMLLIVRRMRTQQAYRPELEDWLFHAVLPLVAYAALIASAISSTSASLFVVGAVSLVLLFIGIHNAWDAVDYLVHRQKTGGTEE